MIVTNGNSGHMKRIVVLAGGLLVLVSSNEKLVRHLNQLLGRAVMRSGSELVWDYIRLLYEDQMRSNIALLPHPNLVN